MTPDPSPIPAADWHARHAALMERKEAEVQAALTRQRPPVVKRRVKRRARPRVKRPPHRPFRPCWAEGVWYPCIGAAAEAVGMKKSGVRWRIKIRLKGYRWAGKREKVNA